MGLFDRFKKTYLAISKKRQNLVFAKIRNSAR